MRRIQFEQTTFITARLRLEPITAAHAPMMFEGVSDVRAYRYIPEEPPATVDRLRARYAFLEDRCSPDCSEAWLNWAMVEGHGSAAGYLQATVRLSEHEAEIAYFTFSGRQRQGLAAEGLRVLLPELQRAYALARVVAVIDTRNVASMRLVESLGFARTAFVEKAGEIRGEPSDEFHYALQFPTDSDAAL